MEVCPIHILGMQTLGVLACFTPLMSWEAVAEGEEFPDPTALQNSHSLVSPREET